MSQQEESKSQTKKSGCCGGGRAQTNAANNKKTEQLKMKSSDESSQGRRNDPTAKRTRARKGGVVEAKIVLLGDSGVGKSSIAMRFCQDRFDEIHDVTIGGAYLQKVISIPNGQDPMAGEQQVKMHIWDTGGHERFRSMINMYYRDAVGAIICYDLTNEHTFKSVEYWVNEMKKNTTADQGGFIMALAGNKCDLPPEQQKVQAAHSVAFAKQHQMIWSEVSAKSGTGIPEMFKKVAEKVHAIKTQQI